MCPSGCGPLYKPGTDLRDTTCPCGFGYFDRDGLFVAGDRVRGGQAISREAYENHPPSCPVHADPRNRDADAPASLGSVEQGHGFRDYFMPESGIDFEVLKIYVSHDGGLASARPTTFHGRSGYLIHAKQEPTVEFIANIKADSARILKLRRKYGEKMPHWAPTETRLQGRQSSGQSVRSSEGRQINFERRESAPVTQSVPFDPQYQTPYAWSGQQPPMQTGYYPSPGVPYPASPFQYANPPGQRSLSEQQTSLADRFGQFSISQASDIGPHSSTTRGPFEQSSRSVPTAIDQQTRATRTRESLSQSVSRNDRPESGTATEEQHSQSESLYQPTVESRRSLTSTTSYSSSSPPQNITRTQDTRTEKARGERPQQAQRPERTYTEPKSQRTTVTPSTRRTHIDARSPPSSRSARREQAPDNQSPPDEDEEEPPKRRPDRDPRR